MRERPCEPERQAPDFAALNPGYLLALLPMASIILATIGAGKA